MKKLIEKYGFVKIFAITFSLWVINFIQSFVEGWTGFYDMHWYNHVLMVPGYLFLLAGLLWILIAISKHWIVGPIKKFLGK